MDPPSNVVLKTMTDCSAIYRKENNPEGDVFIQPDGVSLIGSNKEKVVSIRSHVLITLWIITLIAFITGAVFYYELRSTYVQTLEQLHNISSMDTPGGYSQLVDSHQEKHGEPNSKDEQFKDKQLEDKGVMKELLKQMTTKLTNKTAELDIMSKQLRDETQQLVIKNKLLEVQDKQLQAQAKQLSESLQQVAEKERQLTDKNKRLDNISEQIEELKVDLQNKTEQLEEKSKSMDAIAGQLRHNTRLMEEGMQQLLEKGKRLEELTKQLRGKDEMLVNYSRRLNDLTKNMQNKNAQIDELNGQMADQTKQLNDRQQQLDEKDRQLEDMATTLESKTREVKEGISRLQEQRKRLEEQNKHLQTMTKELEEKDATLLSVQLLDKVKQREDNEKKVKEKTQQLVEKEKQLEDKNKQLEKAKDNSDRLTQQLNDLQTKVKELDVVAKRGLSAWKQPGDVVSQPVWEWIQKAAVDVTLDSNTAHVLLDISKDGKQVSLGRKWKNLPNTPKRFDNCGCVLGKEGFSSGRAYFQVQVGKKAEWDLGVVKESLNRKGNIPLSPKYGLWTLSLRKWSEYKYSFSDTSDAIFLREKPQKVGVYVDYEGGQISFYNADKGSHIYSYTGYTFKERLLPYFYPSASGGNAPLTISPVA